MRRIEHATHHFARVVILVVDEHGIFAFEGKQQPPVAPHRHRPVAREIAFPRMQMPPRNGHVFRTAGKVQTVELARQPRRMPGAYPGLAAMSEEAFEALVPKAPDRAGL